MNQTKQKCGAARAATLLLLLLCCCAAFLWSVGAGAAQLPLREVLRALFTETSGVNRQIVVNLRLPRALCGALSGACLAVSGALLQGVLRNPLASPSIIGVSSGAGLAGVAILVLFPQHGALLPPAAFLGGLAAAALIYLLAWRNGVNPTRMILAGVAVSAFLRAGIDAMLVFFPDSVAGVTGFTVGGLSGASWDKLSQLAPYAAVGLLLAFSVSQRMNILLLGDETAVSLGLRVERTRLLGLAISALLAAAAVSVAGLLGFVGLIVPHLIRLAVGSDQRKLYPASALGGAALVMACDTLGRVIRPPMEVPVGILLAVLGAPFFLYLLRGRSKRDATARRYQHRLRRTNGHS